MSIGLCHEIDSDDQSAVYRFEYKPKKVKTEHDKKAKKRKHEYEEDEDEDEVYFVFHITLMNMLSYSPGWLISSFMFSSFILFSPLVFLGHQAQKEDKRQKGNRRKERQKRRRGEVEMVRSVSRSNCSFPQEITHQEHLVVINSY